MKLINQVCKRTILTVGDLVWIDQSFWSFQQDQSMLWKWYLHLWKTSKETQLKSSFLGNSWPHCCRKHMFAGCFSFLLGFRHQCLCRIFTHLMRLHHQRFRWILYSGWFCVKEHDSQVCYTWRLKYVSIYEFIWLYWLMIMSIIMIVCKLSFLNVHWKVYKFEVM